MKRPTLAPPVLILLTILLILFTIGIWNIIVNRPDIDFDGEAAFAHVEAQMAFSPRPPGSDANRKTGDYILTQLREAGWQTETQEFTYRETPIRNIIGKAGVGQGPIVILGAHYDTRLHADQDPATNLAPVPGANDGASGVAVLLELARTLNVKNSGYEVWLAFFDAEDNGGINSWDWIVGSTFMANSLTVQPQAMILADMIGDADQQIYYDSNSHPDLSKQLFEIADRLGYGEHFIPTKKYSMLDDHTPFARRGIPAVDLIDFDYPYWHTTADTADKLSPDSLERVGRVIETYVEGK
jgi:Zn-dependent M28 family amino/carboxypeptidase